MHAITVKTLPSVLDRWHGFHVHRVFVTAGMVAAHWEKAGCFARGSQSVAPRRCAEGYHYATTIERPLHAFEPLFRTPLLFRDFCSSTVCVSSRKKDRNRNPENECKAHPAHHGSHLPCADPLVPRGSKLPKPSAETSWPDPRASTLNAGGKGGGWERVGAGLAEPGAA